MNKISGKGERICPQTDTFPADIKLKTMPGAAGNSFQLVKGNYKWKKSVKLSILFKWQFKL